MQRKLVEHLASALDAWQRCKQTGNEEWEDKHYARIIELCDNHLPSGSGIDNGTTLDFDRSKPERLVLTTAYHHMTEGFYDGWTDHQVVVKPSFVFGLDINVTGRNRNDIKEYLAEVFQSALSEEI